jgi:predicted nucleotidyltransferase
MDFRRPFEVVTATLDGDVLTVLARADVELTGREIHRSVGHGSHQGIRNAADRLTQQGVVLRRPAGTAHMYRLNRDHVAAPWIEKLATLREQVIERLRSTVAGWAQPPVVAVVFGSVARGQATAESDLDVLVVRPEGCDPDDPDWMEQTAELQRQGTALTGNDTRVLEFSESELMQGEPEAVVQDATREGIQIFGSRRALRGLVSEAAG